MKAKGNPRPTAKDIQPHKLAELFPRMVGEEFDALVQNIRDHGLHQPLTSYQGKVLDGINRLAACKAAKVKPRFVEFTGTEAEALAFTVSQNLTRRHLTVAQRAVISLRFLEVEQEMARTRMLAGKASDPHQQSDEGQPTQGQALELAGKRVGVSRDTVWKASKIAKEAPDVLAAMSSGTVTSMAEAVRIASFEPPRQRKVLRLMAKHGVGLREADRATVTWSPSSASCEWYTPRTLLDVGRLVLRGNFDLDPASCEEAQLDVQADRFFSVEDDGLAQPWEAERLWTNPPYGATEQKTSRQALWIAKLLEEISAGRTKTALLLVRAAIEAKYFAPLWGYPIVFLSGRVDFVPGPGARALRPAAFASCIVGFGVDEAVFSKEFSPMGKVILPDAVPEKEEPSSLPMGWYASRSQEWHTPEEYAEAVREVLGDIDLDPASSETANEVIRAERFYCAEDDGLTRPWGGRVFLNPPYGRDQHGDSSQAKWSEKLVTEYREGNVEAAILLVNQATYCQWFEDLWSFPICFPRRRLKFRGPGRKDNNQPAKIGSVCVYLGPDADRFVQVFKKFGRVVLPDGVVGRAVQE